MDEWAVTIVVALIGAAALIVQHIFNRQGRKEEVDATQRDNLVKRLGEQVDRLETAQQQDRRRIDWLEDEIWSERAHSHSLRRGLAETTDWGQAMERWAAGPKTGPHPESPDWAGLSELLSNPRPRRPPPVPDAT